MSKVPRRSRLLYLLPHWEHLWDWSLRSLCSLQVCGYGIDVWDEFSLRC